MASFKDRRISDLPLALSLEEGSAFLIVNGIDGRPYNQRISTKGLFENIPVPVVVGSELSGRDVTFHASNNSKHNFNFSQETGDVVLGHDALVSNNLVVNGSLRVAGTTIINNVDFDRITVNEEFISKGESLFTGVTRFLRMVEVANELGVTRNLTVSRSANIDEDLTVVGVTTLEDLVANNATFNGNINYNSITTNSIHTTDLTSSGLAEFNKVSIDGNISVGTVFADVGVLDTIQVKLPSEFYAHVGVQSLKVRSHTDTDTLHVHKDQKVFGSLEVGNEIRTGRLVSNSSRLGDISVGHVQATGDITSNSISCVKGVFEKVEATEIDGELVNTKKLAVEELTAEKIENKRINSETSITKDHQFDTSFGQKLTVNETTTNKLNVLGNANVATMQFGNITGNYLNVDQFITSRIDTNLVNAKLVYADRTESVEVVGTNAVFKTIETENLHTKYGQSDHSTIGLLQFTNGEGEVLTLTDRLQTPNLFSANSTLTDVTATNVKIDSLHANIASLDQTTANNLIVNTENVNSLAFAIATGSSLQAIALQSNSGIITNLQTDLANIQEISANVVKTDHSIVQTEDVELLQANTANANILNAKTLNVDTLASENVSANLGTIRFVQAFDTNTKFLSSETAYNFELTANRILSSNTTSTNYIGNRAEIANVYSDFIETEELDLNALRANTGEFETLSTNTFSFDSQSGDLATIFEISTNHLYLSGYELTGVQNSTITAEPKKVPTAKAVYDEFDALDFTKIRIAGGATLETNVTGVLATDSSSTEIFSATPAKFNIDSSSLFFQGNEIVKIDTVNIVDDVKHLPSSHVVQEQFDLVSEELDDLRSDLTSLDQIISPDALSTVTVANTSISAVIAGTKRFEIDGSTDTFTFDTSKISAFGHTFDAIETNLIGSNEAIPTANAVHLALTSANNSIFDHVDSVQADLTATILGVETDLNTANTNLTATIAAIATDLSTANNELSTRITNVANDLATANSTLDAKIDTVYNTLTVNLNTANTALHTRIDGIDADFENKLDQLENAYQTVDSAIRSQIEDANTLFNAADSQIRLDIGLLNAKLNATNTALLAKITTNENNINTNRIDLNTANTTLHTRVDTVSSDLQAANTYLQSLLGSSSSDFESANTAIHARIDGVENDLFTANATLSTSIGTVATDLATANSNLTISIGNVATDLFSANSTLHTRIDAFENDFATANTVLHGRIDQTNLNLSNANTALSASIVSVESDLGTANTTIHGRIDDLASDLANATASLNSTIGALSSNTIVEGATSMIVDGTKAVIDISGTSTTFETSQVTLNSDLNLGLNHIQSVDSIGGPTDKVKEIWVENFYADNLLGITSISTTQLDVVTLNVTGEITATTGLAKITTKHLIANNATLETITNETFVGSSITANNVSANSGKIDVFETISFSSESFSANNLTGNTGTFEILTSNNATLETITNETFVGSSITANNSNIETFTSNNATIETLTANNFNIETMVANTCTANSIATNTLQLAGGEIRRTDDGHGNTIWEFI